MAQKPSEDKKIDLSILPRGAIGIKGLPISRNTRLPSIRSPRDLTLGAPPKRTFMPNIPPRRDKKPQSSTDKPTPHKVETSKLEKKTTSQNEWSKGSGRGKKQIIQTEGSVFGEGVAENPISRKEKMRESYIKSESATTSKSVHVKQEKMDVDVAGVSRKMDELFRDDFLDDGDDDITILSKPTIFPKIHQVKKEACEAVKPTANFNQNVAEEVGFDVDHVRKFIKKEKGTEIEETEPPAVVPLPNELSALFNGDTPQLVLLQFPKVVTLLQKADDDSLENKKSHSGAKASETKKPISTSISSLPEGHIGKLQIMKSGKARLIIGSLSFDLDSISNLKSRHEAVSVRTDSESGDLSILGYMEYKLTFAPKVNSLLS